MRDLFNQEYLNSIIDYNPNTGICFWGQRPRTDFRYAREHKAWNNKHAETQILTTNPSSGKLIVSLFGKSYPLDQLIWAMVKDVKVNAVYHKNKCNADNRWDNLSLSAHKATKYEGGELVLTINEQNTYLIASGPPQKMIPPVKSIEGLHVFNFFQERKDARVYLLELVEKLQTGWTNLIEDY